MEMPLDDVPSMSLSHLRHPSQKKSHSNDSRHNYHYSVNNTDDPTRALHLRGVDRSSMKESTSAHRRPFSLERLAEDPRFNQLCLHAAKSLHRAQGAEFDQDYHISIDKDIEISVVELKLPLGCKYSMPMCMYVLPCQDPLIECSSHYCLFSRSDFSRE